MIPPFMAGTHQPESRANKGLIAGLVVSLVILIAFCALAAFFVVRRMRKRRREREETTSYNDTAPWINKKQKADDVNLDEKTETRDDFTVSNLSRDQSISSEPRMRARTPGGSSAIPVPYDPSETSDEASTHFMFLPQDEAIGVPVPYPLALHVPARVAQAMAERDARWQQYDHLHRQPMHARSGSSTSSGRTHDDLVTISDSRSRGRRSGTDSMLSSNEAYPGTYHAPNHRLSRPESSMHSETLSRSDVGMHGHVGVDGSESPGGPRSPISVADYPIHPPPATTRPQSWRLRRASAAPSQLRSVSENPFATKDDVHFGQASDDGTSTQHEHRLSAPIVSGATAEVVRIRSSPARETVLRQPVGVNPFEDPEIEEDESRRRSNVSQTADSSSVRDSETYAGIVEYETVDGHGSTVFAFPAPPDLTRRSPS